MKLHLPVKLFRAVLACMAAVSFVSFTSATSTCFAATEEEENELLMLLSEPEYPNESIVYTTRQTSALTLTEYESILFKDISSSTDGGAIYNSLNGTFTLSGNGNVTFSGNTAPDSYGYGGAICNLGTNVTFTLSDNEAVTFSGNTANTGGAIYNSSNGTFTLSGNGAVTFSGNTTSHCGCAIANRGTFTLSGNGAVTFSGNTASSYGGAIWNSSDATFTLSGNGDVLFEKNAEVSNGTYRLRSIYSTATLNLSSLEGKSITFRDSLYARGTVNLNQDYTDTEGVVHKSTGDIIFTGATTEADLREVKGGVDGTAEEILNSRTSQIATMTNLYAGRLVVEDKAILKGQGITAVADSGATVRVKDGTLNHSGYALTFNNSTKLEAEGASSITASTVAMKAGSTLSFAVGEANLTTAALTLTGTLTTETISLVISGIDVSEQGRYTYALMKASSYDTSAWTADKITVVTAGVSFDDLVWDNGTLYLNYANLPALTTATWTNASGDGLWNAYSINWTQGGYSYAYADGVDVVFGNEGTGTVSLVGNLAPKSVLINNDSGFDYTFAGTGKLTGTTSLTKQGEGKLTINTANDYTGGTAINGGTLVAGNAAALGTGTVTLKGGTLEIAANDFANNINFAGDSALMVDEGYELLLNTRIANSSYNLTLGGSITFKDISSTSSGGAIYNRGTFELSGNGAVTFSGNTASGSSSSNGGAIYNSSNGTFTLSDNETVTFSGNTASGSSYYSGGAIYNYSNGTFTLSGNGAVTFSGNTASSYGGAIYNSGPFTLNGNGDVTFSNNTASSSGGAIFNGTNATFTLSGNGDVTFSENTASDSGGAISNTGSFELNDNEAVTFSGNTASDSGGAISNSTNATFTLSDNETVTFSGNTASGTLGGGGAIYNIGGTFTLIGNGEVTFSGNTASSSISDHGGAIYNRGTFTLSDNEAVTFSGNTASARGGTIYNSGTFELSGNGEVLFERNAEVMDGTYRLRSIYSSGILNLSALEGKSITFRDSLYASGTVNLNQDYTDSESVVHKSTGDIIFTGATTEADLRAVMGAISATAGEISNSRTSEIATMANLYGGRLIVEDKATLKGQGITAAADSGATVRVKDGRLNHSGYALTFNNSTKLEAEGASSITASTVAMRSGSTLSFVVGEANLTKAALTLTGTLTTGTISVTISGLDDLEAGRYTYALMKASTYNTSAWTADRITIATDGVSFNDLVWDNGTLYLNYANLPALTTATWDNGSGDALWNASSINWTQDGYSYAYADGVDVIFGNEGAGMVSLVGNLAPKSVLVDNGSGFDYTFAGDGKLTGTTALTKQGAGKLTINTANDYTGGTTINGGTLVAGNAAALGTGAVAVNGGTLEIAANGFANDTSFAGNSALVVDAGYQLALSKMLANSGVLTVSGTLNASSLTLNTIAATHVDVNGNSGTSGFAKGAIYSVQVVNGGTAAGADATITHLNLPTGETLVLGENGVATAGGAIDYSEYLLTGSATAATSAIHAKGATATVTQNGGTLTVDDTVTVTATGGTIALNGGTLNGTISGATINAASGTIGATLSGNNTLNGTNYALQSVIANSGVLTVSGTINAAALTLDTTAATHIDVNGNSGASGFAKDAIYAVTLANGTTVNSNATITHGEHTLTLGTDGVAKTGGAIDYSEYLLTGSATAATTAIHAKGASATVTQNGGTLTVDDTVTVTTTGGTIALNGGTLNGTVSGATINAASGALNAALSGTNTLNGNNYALGNVLSNAGALTISGTISTDALTLAKTDATHINVAGASGANGFAKTDYYEVQLVNGGSVVNSNATITHADLPTELTLALGTNGIANAGGVVDYTNYLLVDATTSVSAILGVEGASAATITQQGGTLTVDGDATVTTTAGNIALTSGTLSGTISGANISSTSGAATIAAAISGASSVSVDGGSLTLAGANTYTGATTVTAGTLTVSGSLSGDIALNGGTLNTGSGMTLSNQTLALQGGSVVGNMVLGTGSLLSVDQVSGQTGNLTLGGGTIALSGKKLTLSGALTIGADSVLKLESGYTQEGEYELLGYGSLSGDLKQLQLAAISTTQETRQNYTLSSDGSVLKLTVDGNALVLNWAGGDGTWQSLGSAEWLLPESVSAADKRFHENDSVVFAAGGNVTLVGELKPTAVTVGGTQNVSFGGSGSIVGATTLTKEGSSTLTMNAANAYTGGTTISAGVVNAGGAASFGSGEIALQGGELNLGNHAVANVIQATGGKLSGSAYAGTAYVNGAVSVGDATQLAALVLNGGSISGGSLTNTAITANNGTINSAITGSSAVVSHGTVTLAGTNTYTGGTTIDGGELTVTGSVAGNINLTAGVLNTAAGMTLASGQTLYMAGGSVTGDLSLSAGCRAEVNAATTITGGLTLNGGTLAVSDKLLTLTGMLTVGAESTLDVSGYTTEGTYTLMQYAGLSGDVNDLVMPVDVNGTSRLNYTLSNSGTALVLTLDGNALTLTWKGGNGTWGTLAEQEWDLPEGVSVANARFYAADSVVFTKGGTVTVSGEVMPGHVLVNSAENLTLIGSGSITGATSLTKQGNGTLTLNAANTYSGGTAISAGVVNAGGAGSFGSGKIALSGGELNLGAYAVTNAVEATGGKLSGTAYNGKLTVTGAVKLGNDTTANSVELVSGSLSEGSLTNTTVNATAGSISSRVTGTSTVNVNGNVTLSGANTYTGRTTLSGGTLTAGSITAFGTGLVVVDAGTLNLGGYAVSNTVNAQSGTLTNGGAYAGTLNVNGNVALGGATTAAAVVLNSGSLTGGTLTSQAITAKVGTLGSKLTGACNVDIAGTVSLTGTNDYTGRTTVNSGQLNVGNASALGTSAVALKGGVLNLNGKAAGNAVTATAGTLSGASAYTGALTVKGDLTLAGVTTAGSMALEEGSISGGSIKDTTLTVTQGSIDSSFAGAVTLQATNWALDRVLNNTGVLTMGGSIDASALQLETEGATFVDAGGNKGTSGFARTAAYAVKLVNGGSTVNNQLTVKHGELDMVLGTDGIATAGGVVDYSTYYLNDSTASVNAIHGVVGASSASITQTGGVLTVDGAATVATTGGTIVLNGGTLNGTISGATINATSGALNATLSGTNTLNGTNYALGNVIANQGTLTIGGSFDASALTLNTTAATHVDVNGTSGASGFAKDAFYDVTIATGTVVNNGATVTHGQHTLTLGADGVATAGGAIDYSEYLLTGSDTATTSAIHGVEGASAATVTQNGGTLTVDDTVTVATTGGTIVLNGGTLNGTVSGATINATSGALNATLSGTNTLNGTNYALGNVIANNGTLTIGGTFDASALTLNTTNATHVDVAGNSGASGFAKDAFYDVTIATGTVVNNGATVTHGQHTLTLGADGVATAGGAIDYSEYLLTGSDTATTSAIHGVEGASAATVTQNGGTLTVDDTVTVATTGGTIVLNGGTLNGTVSGATINATSGALNATLSGTNTLNGTNYALGNVIANQGTLTIGGSFDASALTLNTTNATHVDVAGNSGASGFAKDAFYDVSIATGTVVNNGATVTHGQHTLTLGADGVATAGGAIDYSEYLLTGSDTATTSAIHGVEGASAATVTQNGGTLTVDDTVTVNGTGGAITLNGGTLNGSMQGMTIDVVQGTLGATLTGTNTLIGHDFALDTPLDNQGTLVLNGTFDLSGMTPTTTAATHVDVNGASGASGFAKTELQEVAIATGGTINASGATFTHNGHTLTLGEGGVASVGGEVDYSKYLLTGSDTVSSSAIHGVAGAANATVTQTGGTLTADDTVTVTTTGGTIVLSGGTLNGTISGATINAASGALNATLSGENALNGTNYALGSVIANQGTLTVSGSFDASALTLNTTNATHIDVNGASGASGFAKDAFYDVTIATGTVVNNGATVTHGTHSLTLGADGVATAGGVVDYSTYFLHNGAEVAVSAIRAIPEAADTKVDMDGGKLNADADVSVTATGGRIEVSHGADVAGSIRDTQIAIHGCEISADITGSSSVYVDGDTILSGHNTYTGNTEVHEGGYLTVSGSITSDVYLYAGTLDTATGMTLASGQDVFFRGGMVKGNMSTAGGSGLNLNQDSMLDGSLTLGGGTLTLSNGAVLTVSGSLTLDAPTKLVGDWEADRVYTLAEAGNITNNSGNLNEFFAVADALGTVRQEGNRLILDTLSQIKPDETDLAVVNSLWGSLSSVRDFARLAEQQHLIGAPGQTVLWAGAFGSFSDVSDAHPFMMNSGGYAVGAQHAFTESFRCGVALGQSTGTVESKGAARIKDDQAGMMAALTLQYEQALKGRNRALLNGYAALGRVENDAEGAVNANWDDTVLSIGGRASVAMACGEHTWAIPFVGLEWSRAQQGSFSRADGGRYSDGEMSLLTLPVGVTLRSEERFDDGVVFAPELTLAYEANLAKDAPQGTRRMGTKSCTAEGYDPGAGSFMVNGAFNVLLNEHWSVGASYTLRMADQSVNHGMNAAVRYAF